MLVCPYGEHLHMRCEEGGHARVRSVEEAGNNEVTGARVAPYAVNMAAILRASGGILALWQREDTTCSRIEHTHCGYGGGHQHQAVAVREFVCHPFGQGVC